MQIAKERELKIRKWFSMWIDKNCTGIEDLFCQDAVYVESWGPKYAGINANMVAISITIIHTKRAANLFSEMRKASGFDRRRI